MGHNTTPSALAEDSIAKMIGHLTMRNAYLEAENSGLKGALTQTQQRLAEIVVTAAASTEAPADEQPQE